MSHAMMSHASCSCRASEARKHIPENLSIVSLFGWTLGGVYLVRYSESPVGAFDELVILAGLVWNAPTSCAWAQRVYVSNKSARNHGRKAVGLPSRLASFVQADTPHEQLADRSKVRPGSWWNMSFAPHRSHSIDHPIVIQNRERGKRGKIGPVAKLLLPCQQHSWAPTIPMQLPNISGATVDHPGLLKYTCKLTTKVRLLPWRIIAAGSYDESDAEDVSAVLRGKPLLCMEFSGMEMLVPSPEPFKLKGKSSLGATPAPLSLPSHAHGQGCTGAERCP
jgi:hypothetical protein